MLVEALLCTFDTNTILFVHSCSWSCSLFPVLILHDRLYSILRYIHPILLYECQPYSDIGLGVFAHPANTDSAVMLNPRDFICQAIFSSPSLQRV